MHSKPVFEAFTIIAASLQHRRWNERLNGWDFLLAMGFDRSKGLIDWGFGGWWKLGKQMSQWFMLKTLFHEIPIYRWDADWFWDFPNSCELTDVVLLLEFFSRVWLSNCQTWWSGVWPSAYLGLTIGYVGLVILTGDSKKSRKKSSMAIWKCQRLI